MHNTFWISSLTTVFFYIYGKSIYDVQEVFDFCDFIDFKYVKRYIIIMTFEYLLSFNINYNWMTGWRLGDNLNDAVFFEWKNFPNGKIMKLNVHGNKLPSSLGNKLDGQIRCPSADRRRCLCSRAILLILRNFREIFTLRSDASLVIE